MDEYHKGHHIHTTARPILKSGRWLPHIVVTWTNGRYEQSREFDIRRGFANEVDAEMEGMIFAKKWIDDVKPKVR